jgi:hypothetical protein
MHLGQAWRGVASTARSVVARRLRRLRSARCAAVPGLRGSVGRAGPGVPAVLRSARAGVRAGCLPRPVAHRAAGLQGARPPRPRRPIGSALASALLHLPNPIDRSLDADCGKTRLDYRSLHPERRRSGVWLVPVPSRRVAAARRGGQHVELLARRAAAALAGAGVVAAVAPALRVALGVRDSVGLAPADRQANLAGRVLARRGGLPPAGAAVVLIDDVVTTGTTAAACAAALLRMGVDVPAIVVLAAAGCHAPS